MSLIARECLPKRHLTGEASWPHAASHSDRPSAMLSFSTAKSSCRHFSTEFLRNLDHAHEKGEEMKQQSKGNFLDFVEEASKPKSALGAKFIDLMENPGTTLEQLMVFFENNHYKDVTLGDCRKLMTAKDQGILPWHPDAKKY
jgi:hypothetical protein